jgi:hypothetical protein
MKDEAKACGLSFILHPSAFILAFLLDLFGIAG